MSHQAPALDDVAERLAAALGGDGPADARWASALRLRTRLQPAGGAGAKVMPPTYLGKDERNENAPVYAEERRWIGDPGGDPAGREWRCTLLDSIPSQANRIEALLVDRVAAGEIPLPRIVVDQGEFGTADALQLSHRVFDSWAEDAQLDGRRFGDTELFAALASTSRRDLSRFMDAFPAGILLGCWASRSRNPQGSTRLPRIVASEILAVGSVDGRRTASRVDRHHVSKAVKLVRNDDTSEQRFRLADLEDSADARRAVDPSELNYGNVPPGFAKHGGITMDHALQLATVSLPALRESRFPLDGASDPARDVAGRLMLAALALRMVALQVEHGYDLRSGCLLVPEQEPTVELVGRLGTTVAEWQLIELRSDELLACAIEQGARHGLHWNEQTIELVAAPAQLELLRRSLAHAEEAKEAG